MAEPREKLAPPPATGHLHEWSTDELATAGSDVEALLESPGWAAILQSIEDKLRHEQRLMMASPPADDPANQRTIGQWAGLRQVPAIAAGIIRKGKEAQARQRGAEEESA